MRGTHICSVAAIRILAIISSGFMITACHRPPVELKHLGKPPAFMLSDEEGNPYRYDPNSGKVRILFFGYTSCPDYCPATLSKLQRVYSRLPFEVHEKPEFLFISIDPERDTPEVLKAYLAYFKFPVRGLTGPKKELDKVARSFGTFYRIEKKGKDIYIDHSSYVYLVDPEGELRHLFKSRDSAETILDGIQTLYAEMD